MLAFSLIAGLGACLGLAWTALQSKEASELERVDAGLFALAGALVGARVVHVAVAWPYYESHLIEALQVFRGGLSWPGALGGGLLVLALYAAVRRKGLGELGDDLLPLLSALTVSVWLGCWVEGVAYGPQAPSWGLPARDEWGTMAYRAPLQMFGALLSLGLFWSLEQAKSQKASLTLNPGCTLCLAVLLLSSELFVLSFLRADPGLMWRGLRLDAWAALGFTGAASLLVLRTAKRRKLYPI